MKASKLIPLSLIAILLVPLLAPVASLAPLVAVAETGTNTTVATSVNATVNTTKAYQALVRVYEILRMNIEKLVSRAEQLNISIPDDLRAQVDFLLSLNTSSLSLEELKLYVRKAAETIGELVKLLAEHRAIVNATSVLERRRVELMLKLLLRVEAKITVSEQVRAMIEEARKLLEEGNITGAKAVLEKAWAALSIERMERVAEKAAAKLALAVNKTNEKVEKLLEALSGMAAHVAVKLHKPEVLARLSGLVDSVAVVVEAKTLGMSNVTEIAVETIEAAKQAINETRAEIENVTNASSPAVNAAVKMLERAESLVAEAEQALAEGKAFEALVKARIALVLANMAENIALKGEAWKPWMPEPIKPWIPGIPGKKIRPVLPPSWFEVRVKALNATIEKLEAMALNTSRNDLVELLAKARNLLGEATEKYSEGEIAVAVKLYMEAYRIVVVVAKQLGAEDLLPVYIMAVISPFKGLKHLIAPVIGNVTMAIEELKAKIAELKEEIARLANTSSLGFMAKQALRMAQAMLERVEKLVDNAEKLAEKNEALAAKLIAKAKSMIKAVEDLVEKIAEKIAGGGASGSGSGTSESSGSGQAGGGASSGSSGSSSGSSGGEGGGESSGAGHSHGGGH